jgi:tetratricopeptide (TPR) repeat protein
MRMMNDEHKETKPTEINPPAEEDTNPVDVSGAEGKAPKKERKRRPRLRRAGLVFLGLVLILAVSALLGYRNGINRRTNSEADQMAIAAATQFELALQDMQAGRYEVARQRFEYVIGLDPSYPGITEKLAEVIMIANATATPTPSPVPTAIPFTPTPDTRADEELFLQAEALVAAEEWTAAIETLKNLRKNNPNFRSIDVDGMLYLSLRQRGVKKIGLGELEPGIYDLTLAEGFGVLDTEADSWRTWARYYITGASYWDVNWPQAIELFGQTAAQTPNLHDGSGWTAAKRYVDAIISYAQQLESEGKYCEVDDVYDLAFQYTGNATYQELIVAAQEKCQ